MIGELASSLSSKMKNTNISGALHFHETSFLFDKNESGERGIQVQSANTTWTKLNITFSIFYYGVDNTCRWTGNSGNSNLSACCLSVHTAQVLDHGYVTCVHSIENDHNMAGRTPIYRFSGSTDVKYSTRCINISVLRWRQYRALDISIITVEHWNED